MSETGMFIATIAVGLLWIAGGSYIIFAIEYSIDHAAGWLNGMTPEEVNDLREWNDPASDSEDVAT